MDILEIFSSEYRVIKIILENGTITSVELVKICNSKLAWLKTTTYTYFPRLINLKKDIIDNYIHKRTDREWQDRFVYRSALFKIWIKIVICLEKSYRKEMSTYVSILSPKYFFIYQIIYL